jgi:hypothetical protein
MREYGPAFLAKVEQKHARARQHLTTLQAHLQRVAKQLQQR